MNNVKKISWLVLIAIVCFILPTEEAKGAKGKFITDISPGANATSIAKINKDTLVVITGNTYRYTVDTPADKGLVSTLIRAAELPLQIVARDGSAQKYAVTNKDGAAKTEGIIEPGDKLLVTSQDGKSTKTYQIVVRPMALSGKLEIQEKEVTVNTTREITLFYTAGQRSPFVKVQLFVPTGIEVTMDNTTVNVIGRGDVKLKDLSTQSIGRTGTNYSYKKVGDAVISKGADGGSIITFSNLDFRPANGPDLKVVISGIKLSKTGEYLFKAVYTTSKPEVLTSPGTGNETAKLSAVRTISDFARLLDKSLQYKETPETYTKVDFKWSAAASANIQLMQSLDKGKTWKPSAIKIDPKNASATLSGLEPNKLYTFRLDVKDGENKGSSNIVQFFSGKMDIKNFGVTGDGTQDDTKAINNAIAYLNQIGGGTLLFSPGTYSVRTVHLKSNVYLYVEKGATIKALKGADVPETTWFSDKEYRAGLSPTDDGPYVDPENYMTKQDVGHHYFRNTMFFGERIDNVKIIGNGRITGDGNLATSDRVMNNAPDSRADKMFTLKLCTNLEIGGIYRPEDLWYDPDKDEPYYIGKDGSKIYDVDNMLHIDRGGHFVLLATGTDNINVHNTYFAKNSTSNARDIYDFMACNNVTATNIYSKVSSDDIVKPGSDCALGFTRPAKNFKVRNIIGDTNCNLFQIGSETADDIQDACVDNIYVLGSNKAGFSISTNDGAHVKNIHLNCGHTGTIHSRSKMYRTTAPFFISISNRGRVIGSSVAKFAFTEGGKNHNELLCTNVNIGLVENIILNGIDIYEVYGGSAFRGDRWAPYDGKQRKATPIVAGYKLPDSENVEGGLTFTLPNGQHTGYITNISFNDVHVLVKGGNPPADTAATPGELGVGQYNVGNLGIQPSYGLWARHAKNLTITNSSFNYEKPDSRYALYLNDVIGAKISSIKMVKPKDNIYVIKAENSTNVTIENATYFDGEWGASAVQLPVINHSLAKGIKAYPVKENALSKK